jgi:hypothetical protein
MAIQVYDPLSAAPGYFKRPIDNHGKQRNIYQKFVAAIAGDIGSTLNLGKLPPGAVRLYYPDCFLLCSAWGAGALLNIGYGAYRSKQDVATVGDGIEPASANALMAAGDMSAAPAARLQWHATRMKWDFYSLAGVDIIATVAGAVIPVNATLEVWIGYVYE